MLTLVVGFVKILIVSVEGQVVLKEISALMNTVLVVLMRCFGRREYNFMFSLIIPQ